MNPQQFVEHYIRPVLFEMDAYSPEAELLLLGTAIAESRLEFVEQVPNGPALSFYQIEPTTERDMWQNFLRYRPTLEQRVRRQLIPSQPRTEQLAYNQRYATAMARVHYMRVKDALPPAHDLMAMAKYYKQHFNTHLGKATVEKALKAFAQAADVLEITKGV